MASLRTACVSPPLCHESHLPSFLAPIVLFLLYHSLLSAKRNILALFHHFMFISSTQDQAGCFFLCVCVQGCASVRPHRCVTLCLNCPHSRGSSSFCPASGPSRPWLFYNIAKLVTLNPAVTGRTTLSSSSVHQILNRFSCKQCLNVCLIFFSRRGIIVITFEIALIIL